MFQWFNKKKSLHIKLTGKKASESPVAVYCKKQLTEDLKKYPCLHKNIIEDNNCAHSSAKDWSRDAYLILPDDSMQEEKEKARNKVTCAFLNKQWVTRGEDQKQTLKQQQFEIYKAHHPIRVVTPSGDDYSTAIGQIATLVNNLLIAADCDNSKNNPYYFFLVNYANQSGLQPASFMPLRQNLTGKVEVTSTQHISFLIPNKKEKTINIVYQEKYTKILLSEDTEKFIELGKNPFFYKTTLRIHLDKAFSADCLDLIDIEVSIPNSAAVKKMFPDFQKTVLDTISAPQIPAEKIEHSQNNLIKNTDEIITVTNSKKEKEKASGYKVIDTKSTIPINDHETLMNAIARRFNQFNNCELTEQEKNYLNLLRPPLQELTRLKNALQIKYSKVKNNNDSHSQIIKDKMQSINTLCGVIVDQIVVDLNAKGALDNQQRQHLCKLLEKHTEAVLNNKAVKKDDGGKLSQFITTTLRGIISLFAVLSVVPLAVPYVRHSIFRNEAGRVLNDAKHQFQKVSKKM